MPLAAGLLVALSWSALAAQAALTQISSDPFTNPTSNHRTEVEPDTFSFGSTVVSTFQVGRAGISPSEALAVIWALSGPDQYIQLVLDTRSPPTRNEDRLGDTQRTDHRESLRRR